jgi:DedD protein
VSDYPVVNDVDELEVKKRARRRLVGAAALAVVAAIVLPIAMDNDVPPPVPDVQVTVPERGDAPQVVVEPEPDAGKIDIEPDSGPAVAEAVPVPSEPPPPFEVAPEPPSAPTLAEAPPAAPPPVTPPPVVQPAPPASVVPLPEPPRRRPPAPAAKEDESARVLALLSGAEPKPEPPAAEKSSPKNEPKNDPKNEPKNDPKAGKGKVFVQVASFSDAGRAKAMVSDLKKKGFAARAEKAGKVTRVRIGPLSRSEGEKVAAKLKAQGRSAVLTSR